MVYTEDHLTIITDSVLQRAVELSTITRRFTFRPNTDAGNRNRQRMDDGRDEILFYVDSIRRKARATQNVMRVDDLLDDKIDLIARNFFDIYDLCIKFKIFILENTDLINKHPQNNIHYTSIENPFSESILYEINNLMRRIATFFQ